MEKKLIKTWGVAFVLFLLIFSGCLLTILSPVQYVTQFPGGEIIYASLDATAKMWVNNPDYFITVGITGIIALIGASWCVYNMMNKARKEE